MAGKKHDSLGRKKRLEIISRPMSTPGGRSMTELQRLEKECSGRVNVYLRDGFEKGLSFEEAYAHAWESYRREAMALRAPDRRRHADDPLSTVRGKVKQFAIESWQRWSPGGDA